MSRGRGQGSNEVGMRGQSNHAFTNALYGAVDVVGDIQEKHRQAQAEGRNLRIKVGFDPTAPDIHLGHTVVLQRARAFQDAGATVVLIIGDYTARVGDPTGKSKTRPQLSAAEIEANAITYQEQAMKILRSDRLEVRHNSEWLDQMTPIEMMGLLRDATVAQLLARSDFAKRYENNQAISLLELVYPLLQGHDSVAVNADIELGGTDQLYNLHVGRDMNEQCLATFPLLVGIDGQQKMSKSLDNYIGVNMEPSEMYGRFMRVPDEALPQYWQLLTPKELGEKEAARLATRGENPMYSKRRLAEYLITRYHDEESAAKAKEIFDSRHVTRQVHVDDIKPMKISVDSVNADNEVFLPAVLQETFDFPSRSHARRLIRDGAVKINGNKIDTETIPRKVLENAILQAGKRNVSKLISD